MPMSSTQRQPRGYRAAQDLCAGNGIDCAAAEHENVKLGAYYFNEYVIREMNNWKNKEDVTAEMLISGAPGVRGFLVAREMQLLPWMGSGGILVAREMQKLGQFA